MRETCEIMYCYFRGKIEMDFRRRFSPPNSSEFNNENTLKFVCFRIRTLCKLVFESFLHGLFTAFSYNFLIVCRNYTIIITYEENTNRFLVIFFYRNRLWQNFAGIKCDSCPLRSILVVCVNQQAPGVTDFFRVRELRTCVPTNKCDIARYSVTTDVRAAYIWRLLLPAPDFPEALDLTWFWRAGRTN